MYVVRAIKCNLTFGLLGGGGGFHPKRIVADFQLIFSNFFQPSLVAVRGSFVHISMYYGLKLLNWLPDYT
jgi:hypothetical protein